MSKPVTVGVMCTSPPSSPSVSTSAFAPSGPVARGSSGVPSLGGAPAASATRTSPIASTSQKTIVLRFTGRSCSSTALIERLARCRAHRTALSSTASDRDRRRSFSEGPVGASPYHTSSKRAVASRERRRRLGHRPRDVGSLLTGRLAGHVVEKAVARELRDQRAVAAAQRVSPPPCGLVLGCLRPPVVRAPSSSGAHACRGCRCLALHPLAEPEQHQDDQHDCGDEDHARDEASTCDAADRVEHAADGLGDPSLDPFDDRRAGTVELGTRQHILRRVSGRRTRVSCRGQVVC